MQQKLQRFFAVTALTLGSVSLQAQTISTLDDLILPSPNSDFAGTQTAAGDYEFQSGHVKFFGTLESWGGYGRFNYTNVVDSTNPSFTNDKAAITGKGYDNSDNYGVVYLTQDYPAHPTQSLLIGAKLQGAAAGSKVLGTYLTNTTYAYLYMKDNYTTGDFLKLVIRGYLNNVKTTDSVIFDLAKYTATDTVLVKNWEWVNLLPLGNVDSINFQILSSDDFTPYYAAFDNFTTLDGVCPHAAGIIASTLNENSVTITWNGSVENLTTDYEVAVDVSNTLAPTATAVTVTAPTYSKNALVPNTTYYAHIRATCPDGGFSDWDTASFKTLPVTGISNANGNEMKIVLSPNPANDFIHLQTAISVDADIYNLEGRLLRHIENAKQVDIRNLAAGTYLLRVVNDKNASQQSTLRFIKN
ncbi:DUF4465 domain-containing protein [Taibaiella lutea]|uniref:DUF4465 domain-containing protein n=1 Tax=Taibaiella lutea TaxID=2608001 RepID=A0A5M6CM10_9BACT|nr:DUF4465 domain-containing protein [Taibaiella lutea]KAA5536093.1 DUF4465 domain-containing protein [Taibaiella lutea]